MEPMNEVMDEEDADKNAMGSVQSSIPLTLDVGDVADIGDIGDPDLLAQDLQEKYDIDLKKGTQCAYFFGP